MAEGIAHETYATIEDQDRGAYFGAFNPERLLQGVQFAEMLEAEHPLHKIEPNRSVEFDIDQELYEALLKRLEALERTVQELQEHRHFRSHGSILTNGPFNGKAFK